MNSELNKLTIKQALSGLKNKSFSVSELTSSHIKAIEANRHLNAFITETFELATEKAKESELKYLNGEERVLEGIPISVKDVFCTKNVKTTNASKILSNFIPTYESTVSGKFATEGSIMLGKTNMDEFAMGSAGTYSAYGASINPWKAKDSDKDLVPGGSSSGSASAVSAFMSMAALGTDTGGSVRLPASYCGIVGFKPSYGRCSRYGVIAFASSLDQPAFFARTVEDTALIANVAMGYDSKDSTSANIPLPNLNEAMARSVKGMRIGIPKEYNSPSLDPNILKLWMDAKEMLEKEGAEVVEVSLPNTKYAVAAYYVIAPAEASTNLSRYDGVRYGLRVEKPGMSLDEMYSLTRAEGFGDEVKRRIIIGTYVLSAGFHDAYFGQAQKVRRLMTADFKDAFEQVDALLTPVSTNTAFSIDEMSSLDPTQLYLNDIFTIPASMAGLPAISIPGAVHSQSGLPIGLQVITNKFREDNLFTVSRALERVLNFNHIPAGY